MPTNVLLERLSRVHRPGAVDPKAALTPPFGGAGRSAWSRDECFDTWLSAATRGCPLAGPGRSQGSTGKLVGTDR
jgi:hypothetical protein